MTEGADDPQTWWKIDIANGKAEEIGYPIDHADGPVQVFKYNAGDGTAIEGVLTLPPGRDPKNLPVVVLPHGGPAARDYPASVVGAGIRLPWLCSASAQFPRLDRLWRGVSARW
jgi:dipeptidyl aminopeptidase/acylaminoacyl peptidase